MPENAFPKNKKIVFIWKRDKLSSASLPTLEVDAKAFLSDSGNLLRVRAFDAILERLA